MGVSVLASVSVALSACAPDGSGGGGGAAQASSAGGVAGGAGTAAATGPRPLVLVHGIGGQPADWHLIAHRLAAGRTFLPELHAADAEALPTGSLSPDAIVSAGYYREANATPRFYPDRFPVLPSIGGAPLPRQDPLAADYAIAYVEQLDRIVESVCRAAGTDQVDLAGYSMGGVVARAYTRWRSVKAPGVGSRVRRLLTLGTPNHGINSLEATLVALTSTGVRAHVGQGEAAELNYACGYWGPASYMTQLNDGWSAFLAQHGIEHGNAWAHGHAVLARQSILALQHSMAWLNGPVSQALLAHPTPGYDYLAELAEASGDGDGVVRAASATMPAWRYPDVRFDARSFAPHGWSQDPGRGLGDSVFSEALLRRFALGAERQPGFQIGGAHAEVVELRGERAWLLLSVDVRAGTPLSAEVLVRPRTFGFPADILGAQTRAFGALLEPGPQAFAIDLEGIEGSAQIEVRLYGLDGEVELTPLVATVSRHGRPAALLPAPSIDAVTPRAGGGFQALASGGDEVRFALAPAGAPAAPWSAWQRAQLPLDLPPLGPGLYELRVRARSAIGPGGAPAAAPRHAAARLAVDPSGALTVRR